MLQTFDGSKTCEQEQAYVMINCDDDGELDVVEKMRSMKGVNEIVKTVGAYDVIAKVTVPSIAALRETIVLKIRRIPQVRMTTTIVCTQSSFLSTYSQG